MKKTFQNIILLVILLFGSNVYAQSYEIGVYYFPGWTDTPGEPWNPPWEKIKPYPEREPLIGYYPEKEVWVAEKHIEWAYHYGISFFAYDWYWDGQRTKLEHALQNHLKAKNSALLKFCLLWANHSAVPKTLKEFDNMVIYWIDNYFNKTNYYRIDDKPVVFIFSVGQLEINAKKFGEFERTLLDRANSMVKAKGYKGIYFVAVTNEKPSDRVESLRINNGFSAYTGWNYVAANGARIDDYNKMVDAYLDCYRAAAQTARLLPYIVPTSPGWDSRPWQGDSSWMRTNPTPDKFETMLVGAKQLMDSGKAPKILVIEAWNEFGEGSYIEPTKKWGFKYLETIQKVFHQQRP